MVVLTCNWGSTSKLQYYCNYPIIINIPILSVSRHNHACGREIKGKARKQTVASWISIPMDVFNLSFCWKFSREHKRADWCKSSSAIEDRSHSFLDFRLWFHVRVDILLSLLRVTNIGFWIFCHLYLGIYYLSTLLVTQFRSRYPQQSVNVYVLGIANREEISLHKRTILMSKAFLGGG